DGKPKRMFIGGKWREAASGKTFATHNPATGEVLAQVAEGDSEDIDRADPAEAGGTRGRAYRGIRDARYARHGRADLPHPRQSCPCRRDVALLCWHGDRVARRDD